MEEEQQVEDPPQEAASESVEVTETVQPEEKTVPLAAYEAERKKRQEIENHNRALQDFVARSQKDSQPKEQMPDPDEWISRREMLEAQQRAVEKMYADSNPEKLKEINTYLDTILEQKPWLREAISSSGNRLATAHEVVQDYKHVVLGKKEKAEEAKRMVQNANKPGSPLSMAKTAGGSNSEYLLSLRGSPDFKKYRQEMLKGKR